MVDDFGAADAAQSSSSTIHKSGSLRIVALDLPVSCDPNEPIRDPTLFSSTDVDFVVVRADPSVVVKRVHESGSVIPVADKSVVGQMLPVYAASSGYRDVSVATTLCASGSGSSSLATTPFSSPTQQASLVPCSPNLEVCVVVPDMFAGVSNTMDVSASSILQPMEAGVEGDANEPTCSNVVIPSTTNVHPMSTMELGN
ncbi:hypothetical protein V6N11_040077 [Hibiscus sabdariffa]|uniref:Uncharacterized protein n=1 Tax=Hibiscus sabdariffa TaxID=183260 RepID=A0ABR2RGS4_9ROSI